MAEIMVALAGQLQQYVAQAEDKFDARCEELREAIMAEFAEPNTKADKEAFGDPDYQFVLRSAQETFGRKGTEDLKIELVRLLGERSASRTGSRLAMVLNDAIRVSGNLTREEYAALALCFAVRYVSLGSAGYIDLIKKWESLLQHFQGDLPQDQHSYDYLSSMGCASVSQLGEVDLWSAIQTHYGFRFHHGLLGDEIQAAVAADGGLGRLSGFVYAVPGRFDGRVQFAGASREDLETRLQGVGYSQDAVATLLALHDSKAMTLEEIKVEFSRYSPSFAAFSDLWASTPIKNCELTALGKALAHSALVSAADFDAPLDIWVK